MKLVRFELDGRIVHGCVEKTTVSIYPQSTPSREFALSEVRLLAPAQPTKVVAVGLNYRDHAEEVGLPIPDEPLLFLKPASSVIGPEDSIIMPSMSSRVDYEAELAVVIGKTAVKVPEEKAGEHILGYTCLNDVTARDLQAKDGQWTRAKGFDTFCPIGPWVETELDPWDLRVELFLNHERRQHSRTSNLVFNVFRLVSYVSHIMTLVPGDIIATGTPSGIGPMSAGDSVEVRVEGIGSLVNHVKSPV